MTGEECYRAIVSMVFNDREEWDRLREELGSCMSAASPTIELIEESEGIWPCIDCVHAIISMSAYYCACEGVIRHYSDYNKNGGCTHFCKRAVKCMRA